MVGAVLAGLRLLKEVAVGVGVVVLEQGEVQEVEAEQKLEQEEEQKAEAGEQTPASLSPDAPALVSLSPAAPVSSSAPTPQRSDHSAAVGEEAHTHQRLCFR